MLGFPLAHVAEDSMTLPDYPKDVLKWAPQLPDEWLHELGRITLYAAAVEETLHLIYWQQAKLDGFTGPVITGDHNPRRLTEDIKKLMLLRPDQKARLDDMSVLITEHRELAHQRNQCIHWVWTNVVDGKASVAPPAYDRRQHTAEYTLDALRTLADDMAWLRTRLLMHLATDENLREIRATRGAWADVIVPAPWLDKQAPPSPKPSRTRAIRKSRRRQPQSSPE
jgi:hypothetical protein